MKDYERFEFLDSRLNLGGMSVECVQASAFDVESDVTMQHYTFFEKIIKSNYQKFTFMQRQSPKPFTFLLGRFIFY